MRLAGNNFYWDLTDCMELLKTFKSLGFVLLSIFNKGQIMPFAIKSQRMPHIPVRHNKQVSSQPDGLTLPLLFAGPLKHKCPHQRPHKALTDILLVWYKKAQYGTNI
uniref:Uncharacterized protein n=1 Tax=Sarcophilus harrisii TaxID=9305 RepID=A0A7N4UZI6_SARHA